MNKEINNVSNDLKTLKYKNDKSIYYYERVLSDINDYENIISLILSLSKYISGYDSYFEMEQKFVLYQLTLKTRHI